MKEVFVDEWVYRPRAVGKGKQGLQLKIHMKAPVEPFQLYVIKMFKIIKSTKDDYDDFMKLMGNFSPADRKAILKYMGKFLPGDNKIKNIRLGGL